MSRNFKIGALIALVILVGLFIYLFRPNFFRSDANVKNPTPVGQSSKTPSYIDDELVVKFGSTQTDDSINTKLKENIGQTAKSIKKIAPDSPAFSNVYVLKVDTDSSTKDERQQLPDQAKEIKQAKLDDFINSLKSDADVIYAEKNEILHIGLEPNDPYFKSTGSWGQSFPDMWGLQKIQAPSAWDITTGSDSVVVAVTDTGIDYNLPELKDNILRDASGKIVGYDFINNDADPMDDYGHGTHVSGTIGALGNNGLGVAGVAWNVKLMPVKVFDANGNGANSTVAQGVIWGADHGARISNNSWGGVGSSQVIFDAFQYAYSKGELMIASAGNSATTTQLFYPASYENALTVSAFDFDDKIASFSNSGMKLDVSAPGVDILSLKSAVSPMCKAEYIVGTNYCYVSGTSMASPHVSGLAALLLSKNPSLTNEQLRQAIRKGADDVATSGFDIYSAYGRINAYKSLSLQNPLASKILEKQPEATNPNIIDFSGIASGPTFSSYDLSYSNSLSSTRWTSFASSKQPVTNGFLGKLDTTKLQGDYLFVKLTTTNTSTDTFTDFYQVPAYASIKGQVLDAVTKRPIGRVTLSIQSAMYNSQVVADRNGNYIFSKLPVGEANNYKYSPLTPSLKGYYGIPLYNIQLKPGEVKTINLVMTAYKDIATVTGKVTDAVTGQPLNQIAVGYWVLTSPPGVNPGMYLSKCSSRTDATGTYVCRVPEGTYTAIITDDMNGRYQTSTLDNIFIPAKITTTKNFTLSPK